MRWKEVPRDAKAYIIYHTLLAPQLIIQTLFPLYMLYSGYSLLEVGAFFTVVNIASIPVTYLIGRAFNRWDIKKGILVMDFLDGIAYVLYGLAKGASTPITLFIGKTFEKLSAIFHPLYRAYEQIIYPEEKYEEIFAWHLRLPQIARIVTFPILGYLFGYVYTKPEHYRLAFIGFGLLSIFTMVYVWLVLPSVGKEERIMQQRFTFRIGEFKLLLAFETLLMLAWFLAPEIVLINYVIFVLKKTVFEVTLIAVASSIAAVIGTYASERVPKEKGFRAIGFGMFLSALYALIMSLSPPFWLVILAYALEEFGDNLWFPFYRSWMFKLIPKERASEFHAAITSYQKVIALFTPFVAGALASIHATLPYAVSFTLFVVIGGLFFKMSHKSSETFGVLSEQNKEKKL
ncbi:MFS transporter [Thermococcus sp.]